MKRSAITIDYLKSGFLALLFILTGASGTPAVAHPHAWIDLRSTVVLDAAMLGFHETQGMADIEGICESCNLEG